MSPADLRALRAAAREAIREGWLAHELDVVYSAARDLGVELDPALARRLMAGAAETTASP